MALSLYQYERQYKSKNNTNFSSMTTGLISANHFGTIVTGFNSQYNGFVNSLRVERSEITEKLAGKLAENPSFVGMRNDGVNLAWKYEQADVQMGGKGSADWTEEQRQEILDHGKVRGAEGHHGKNVADHPEDQADPDNIKFYKSRNQHLEEGHDGNWQNESDMPKTDKEAMLRRTNQRRVVKKELEGIALSAAIGFGVGASIEVISTLAREGVSIRTVRLAFVNGLKAGLKSAAFAVGSHVLARVINFALQKVPGISAAWANVIGTPIVMAIFSAIEFFILKKNGFTTMDAIKQVIKDAAIRLVIWAISFIPYAGSYISLAANLAYTAFGFVKEHHDARFDKELNMKMVMWSLPEFA